VSMKINSHTIWRMNNNKKVYVLIPVAPFEPLSIIKRSVTSLRQLKTPYLDLYIIYIVDCLNGYDERIRYLENEHIRYICRLNTRGRRAGAVNDAMSSISRSDGTIDADHIALFDVDSRPDPDFLMKCINEINNNPDCVIASGVRYITNCESGWVASTIAAEYSFFNDVYRFSRKYDGFIQFNGLIGVIDARTLDSIRLNEHVYCEDLDFTQKVYIAGKKPALADCSVGEQAPTTIKELYNQRVRWLSGALDGLINYIVQFQGAPIPVNRKVAWFISMTLPFAAFILTPLVPVYGLRLWIKGEDHVFYKTLGLSFHVWLITLCGMTAVIKRIFRKKTVWTDSSRCDI
jgi:1,2-diacylglycerol 3-beta-glucosyltransferase